MPSRPSNVASHNITHADPMTDETETFRTNFKIIHFCRDGMMTTMEKRFVRVALSSLVLLLGLANLNAFTFASVPMGHAKLQSRQNTIINNLNSEKAEALSVFPKYESLTSIRAGSDASMERDEPHILSQMKKFVSTNFFLVGMFVAVTLAKLFPSVSTYIRQIAKTISSSLFELK